MSTHTSTNTSTSGHITGPADLVTALRHALGDAHVLTGADAAGYLTDQHGRLTGQALAVHGLPTRPRWRSWCACAAPTARPSWPRAATPG